MNITSSYASRLIEAYTWIEELLKEVKYACRHDFTDLKGCGSSYERIKFYLNDISAIFREIHDDENEYVESLHDEVNCLNSLLGAIASDMSLESLNSYRGDMMHMLIHVAKLESYYTCVMTRWMSKGE